MSKVSPCLWFDANAEEAARFYVSLFPDSRMISPGASTPREAGPPVMVVFELEGRRVMGINGGPTYKLGPAFSMFVDCADQAEVDRYWVVLTADGGRESRCGWLEDRFGVSWQIVPRRLGELMGDPDRERAERVRQAMFKMSKLVVADLEAAYRG
jgi:predicted 3-demethylubiquinone-9 3-methyltransferase (glyoxalase superfamily)